MIGNRCQNWRRAGLRPAVLAVLGIDAVFVVAIVLGVSWGIPAEGGEAGIEVQVDNAIEDRRNTIRNLLDGLKKLETYALDEVGINRPLELESRHQSKENKEIVAIIRGLGAYRSTEAVSLLVDRIDTRDQSRDPVISLSNLEKHFPAVVALIEIGGPAVGPLLEKISNIETPQPFRMDLTKWILYRIYNDTEMVLRRVNIQTEQNDYTADQVERLDTFARFVTDSKAVLDEMSGISGE